MSDFSPEDLRRAATALDIVERLGDPDQWSMVLQRANATTGPTPGQSLHAGLLASRLATLLGESRDLCEQAAEYVFTPSRHQALFAALINYAAELSSKTTMPAATSLYTPRPIIRIVGDKEAAA
jgi:hypothetical protein